MYVSIIMPAYNASKYIGRALDTLLTQSFDDYEIILFNDGSNDDTARICVDYSERNSRIVFVDKENEGVAITRNRALKIAKGEYILFVDADDVIFPGSLQAIADKLKETQVDLLRFEFKTIDEYEHDLYPNYEAKRRRKYINKVMDAPDFMNKVMRGEYQLCFNVFRKQLLEQYKISFLEGCTYNEDTLFLIQYFCISKTHVYIPNVVYGYRKFAGAVTNNFTEKNFKDVTNVYNTIIALLPEEIILHEAIKVVAENIGKTLYLKNKTFKNKIVQEDVIKYCATNPVTLDWKLFILFGSCSWKYLDLVRKIKRRFQ